MPCMPFRDMLAKLTRKSKRKAETTRTLSNPSLIEPNKPRSLKISTAATVQSPPTLEAEAYDNNDEIKCWDEILEKLTTTVELGIPTPKGCILAEDLEKIISRESVSTAFPNAEPQLIEFAIEHRKLFATTCCIAADRTEAIKLFTCFMVHNYTDQSLPNTTLNKICKFKGELSCQPGCRYDFDDLECGCDASLKLFHHHPWTFTKRKDFYERQSRFLVPKIGLYKNNKAQYCNQNEVLPLLSLREEVPDGNASGFYSNVYCGKFLMEYQFQFSRVNEWMTVAVKQLNPQGNDVPIEGDWKREIDALQKFNDLKHEHIVRAVGACKHCETYYIFLEWARNGDLTRFWKKNPNPVVNASTIHDILCQFHGLFNALSHIHDDANIVQVLGKSPSFYDSRKLEDDEIIVSKSPSSFRSKATTPDNYVIDISSIDKSKFPDTDTNTNTANFVLEVDEPLSRTPTTASNDKTSNWAHRDIKPGNILIFPNDSSWSGTFKFGDLGRARRNDFRTASPLRANSNDIGTSRYEPPEVTLKKNAPRSRLWDVWSMGCVMFETIYWLLYGINELNASCFTEYWNPEDGNIGTWYWSYDTHKDDGVSGSRPKKSAKVNPKMEKLMDWILDNDPECSLSHRKESVVRDLLLIVKKKMLIIALKAEKKGDKLKVEVEGDELKAEGEGDKLKAEGEGDDLRDYREGSKEITKALSRMIEKCKDSSYLYSGQDRTLFKPPELDADGNVKNIKASRHNPVDRLNQLPMHGQLKLPNAFNSSSKVLKLSQQKLDTYAFNVRDIWEFLDDKKFVSPVLEEAIKDSPKLLPDKDSQLCKLCKGVDFESFPCKPKYEMSDLINGSEAGCELCELFLNAIKKIEFPSDQTVQFERSGSLIKLGWRENPLLFSISQSSGNDKLIFPMGLPNLTPPRSQIQYSLIRSWISDCDKHAKCRKWQDEKGYFPKRLIRVGNVGAEKVFIVNSESIKQKDGAKRIKYFAFSHPWGSPDTNKHLATTQETIDEFIKEGIEFDALPNTFKEATEITRNLGIQYLWIDSLCILQGNNGDFLEQSDEMENIYRSSYLTISASGATGSSDQLMAARPMSVLKGQLAGKDEDGNDVLGQRQVVRISSKSGIPFYIGQSLDNFESDVLQSNLSTRGWVFQERALSRRSIYITKSQIYWECGEGVRCETLTKLKNPVAGFLGDSDFPTVALELSKGGKIYYYQSVFESYSRLSFTFHQDRSVAINGLQKRMCKALDDRGEFGLFRRNLGRSLLWRKGSEVKALSRIPVDQWRGQRVPSWSWMSCYGGIDFFKIYGASVIWKTDDILWDFVDQKARPMLTASVSAYKIPQGTTEGSTSLEFDYEENIDPTLLACIIIGLDKSSGDDDVDDDKNRNHYVLIVQRVSPKGGKYVYERVGVGTMLGSFVGDEICHDATII